MRARAHICHRYHGFYPWRKNCHVEKFQLSIQNLNNLWIFIEVYDVVVPNLCGEKSVQRKSVWRKNDKYEVCITQDHLIRPPRLKTRPSQMLIALHFGYTPLHKPNKQTNKRTRRNRKVRFRQCYVSDIGYTCTFTLLAITLRPGCLMIYL